MLCSQKNSSLLRKTSKEDLIKFKLESLGEEWKTRAPLFHSFSCGRFCQRGESKIILIVTKYVFGRINPFETPKRSD